MSPAEVAKRLRSRPVWIFDLDGTLTIAQHDFDAIRRKLGIVERAPILESLAAMPEAEAREKKAWLDEMEAELAAQAHAAPGAHSLLSRLRDEGHRMGILTRNSKPNAHICLEATQLADFFEAADVMGRDEAPPKPSPVGIQKLLGGWSRRPDEAVMLGDYHYDLDAGRNAGTMTVHVDVLDRFDFGERADLRTLGLEPLYRLLFDPQVPRE